MKSLSQKIKRFYFPAFVMVGFIIYSAQQTGIVLPAIVGHYVNDFFCIPLVLYCCQWSTRRIKSDANLRLPLSLLVTVTALYSWYFEWFLPPRNTRYTGDWIDVILYFSGLLFFYVVEYGYDSGKSN